MRAARVARVLILNCCLQFCFFDLPTKSAAHYARRSGQSNGRYASGVRYPDIVGAARSILYQRTKLLIRDVPSSLGAGQLD
ncbi:hypothetical protein D3C87_1816280 [compost metagenome]